MRAIRIPMLPAFWMGLLLLAMGAAQAQVPIVGESGLTLKDLVGAPKLATVVLKSGAQDPNVRIIHVGTTYFKIVSPTGEDFSYRFDDVKEVRVQEGKVEGIEFDLSVTDILSIEERKTLGRAMARALKIYESRKDNQLLRMDAAVLLQFAGDNPDIPSDKREEALEYLRELAVANDLQTALEATRRLYLAGKADATSGPVLKRGLESGNRMYKGMAAELTGLLGADDYNDLLLGMGADRFGMISAPALRALGRLGNEEAITLLLKTITEQNPAKGEAAVFSLSRLGGAVVVDRLHRILDDAKGEQRFRTIKTLYSLKDPLGEQLLREESLAYPTLELEAALVLTRNGDYQGKLILNQKLDSSYGDDTSTLMARAGMAAALVKGSDRRAVTVLQELLRIERKPEVTKEVCYIFAELGLHYLLGVTQPIIDSGNPEVALAACQAVVAMIYPDFRARFAEMRS